MIWPNSATLSAMGSFLWDSLHRGLSRFNATGNPLRLRIEREILEDCCEFEDISEGVFEQRTGAKWLVRNWYFYGPRVQLFYLAKSWMAKSFFLKNCSCGHRPPLQWRNRVEREFIPAFLPSFLEFFKVKFPPFIHQFQGFFGQKPFMDFSGFDLNQGLVFGINRMEVHGRVLTIVKSDHDAVKATYFRHGPELVGSVACKRHPGKSPSLQTKRSGRMRQCALG